MDPLMAPVTRKMVQITNLDEIIGIDEEEIEQQVVEASPKKKTRGMPPNAEPIARRYQLEILEQALEKNTLVYLETEWGKTLIALLLIKEMGIQLREQQEKGEKEIIIFLTLTVQLVIQQYEVISINTDMRVEEYYETKGVDVWTSQAWNDEINKHEVLVMTPQILLHVLRHGFLKLEMIKLIIFDEFHYTLGNHPYAQIMKEQYQKSPKKPKIFGMTASPSIRKGISSGHDWMDQIVQLEGILDSQVYALEERSELEIFVPMPKHSTIYYSPSCFNHDVLKLELSTLSKKYETLQECQGKTLQSQFKDYVGFMKNSKTEIRSIHGNIEYCLEKLGLFCALKAVELFKERCKTKNNLELEAEDLDSIKGAKNGFLEEALQILKCWLPTGMEKCYIMHEDNQTAVKEGLLTPKVYILVQFRLSYRKLKEMHCIIFVETMITASVISSLINGLDSLSNIRSAYLVGGTGVLEMCQIKQQSTSDLFSAGKVNVLVTTNVTEGGLDVQDCRCIIHFDSPNTVHSYIQSRGQACNPKSDYVALVERNNEMKLKMLSDVMSEESTRNTCVNRNQILYTTNSGIDDDERRIPYNVLSTGATVTCDSSVDLIYRYCAKLPRAKYYLPQTEFVCKALEGKDNLYICILRLPPNALFQEVVGHPSGNIYLAKQLARLEACKKLHEVGALEQLPINEAHPKEEKIVNSKNKSTTGAGTTKRKELHITSKAKAFSGNWGDELNGVTLQVYKLVFTSQDDDNGMYSNFILLIEAKLDSDVANSEIDLHLTGGRVVRSRFVPCAELHLDSIQISDAKAFHEILFNGIFNRLVLWTKETNEPIISKRNISRKKMEEGIWESSNMYFLLPLESEKSGVCHNEASIDWKSIHQCADVARSLKGYRTAGLQVGENDTRYICLATGPISDSDLLEKAVLTLHTGKIYCVTNILHDKTAESPFPDIAKYKSYSDYFEKKYGMKLNFSKQPLLQVKQSHRPHNLLARYCEKYKGKEFDLIVEPTYIELPPEVCLNLGVTSSVICSLYLLPSVMHRMNTLMLSNQLREEIQECSNCPCIPSTLIMKALTTMRCLESFSSEQLELLGDSVLKYAVSCHLFLKYDKKNEGQLSAYRSLAVCNATLHALATSRNLPGYIRDEPFDPSRWNAPGTHCKRIVPCCCDEKKIEESVEGIVVMEDKVVKIGKTCDKGHRWMCSKTIADFVEALIGSYLVGGGLPAALEFMNWMNIPVAYGPELVNLALEHAFVNPNSLRKINIHAVESHLGYVFHQKALLVEAITHATQEDSGGCCYQAKIMLTKGTRSYQIPIGCFQ